MKKLLQILLLSIAIPVLTGCGGDLNPFEDGHHRVKKEKEDPVMKRIKMSFGGDFISESEEPLQRAEDGDTYVGINVTRVEITADDSGVSERYAYGFFKGKDDIFIDLETGYKYSFKASIVIENRDKLALANGQYQEPFTLNNGEYVPLSQFLQNNTKVFTYFDKTVANDDRSYFPKLKTGSAMVDMSESISGAPSSGKLSRYPRLKRFYGELANYDPSGIITDVSIPMVYKSFGLKFVIGTIPEGTYVTVKDITTYSVTEKEDYKKLAFTNGLTLGNRSNDFQSWEGIYSLNNFKEDSETFMLKFIWNKLSGSPEEFEHPITVYARKLKVLTLNIEGDPGEVSETKSGNITFTMSDQWEEADENYNETVNYKKKE